MDITVVGSGMATLYIIIFNFLTMNSDAQNQHASNDSGKERSPQGEVIQHMYLLQDGQHTSATSRACCCMSYLDVVSVVQGQSWNSVSAPLSGLPGTGIQHSNRAGPSRLPLLHTNTS